MKKNQWLKRLLSFTLALALMFTSMGFQSLATYAAEEDSSLAAPVGLCNFAYTEEDGIEFVWGNDGRFPSFEVTIKNEDGSYSKVYPNQACAHHKYPDEYQPGKYTIEVRGELDGKVSLPATGSIVVPGEVEGGNTTPTQPEQPQQPATGVNHLEFGSWDFWTGEGGAGTKTDNEDGSVSINITAKGGQTYAVQYTHALNLTDGMPYELSMDFLCDADAAVYLNIQESFNWTSILPNDKQKVELKAGETYHYTATTGNADGRYATNGKLAIMFGNDDINVGKTIKISNIKLVGDDTNLVRPSEGNENENPDKEPAVKLPSYTKIGENLGLGGEGKHEDWVEHSSAEVENYSNGAFFDIQGYEGYEAYQTRFEKAGLSLKEGKNYLIKYDIVSNKDKKTMLRVDDLNNGYAMVIDDLTYELKGNEESTVYAFTGTISRNVENARVFAGLGMIVNDAAYKVMNHTVTIENFEIYEINEAVERSVFVTKRSKEAISLNFAEKGKEDDGFVTWSDGNNASYEYNDDNAVITSGWWGEQNSWTVQFAVQNITLPAGKYTVAFDLLSTFNKPVYAKVTQNASDTPLVEKRVELTADEPTHFEMDATISAADVYRVFFNLGGGQATEGSVTISNFVITDEDGNGVNLYAPKTPEGQKRGPEYDFSKDNSEFDFADPGLVKEGYELIWADEFDGNYDDANVDANTGLNLNNWAYQLGDGSTDCGNYGWGNSELQAYTDRAENIKVNEDLSGDGKGDGLLRITAKYEDNGYNYANEGTKKYTSARIRTTKPGETLFTTTYGYVEARISLPETKGAWPAFWMLPESTEIYGGWPVSGEIDILETTGSRTDEACSTLHWGTPAHVYKGSGYQTLNSEMQYFHTYAVDWEPGKFTFYYDGKAIYESTNWESAFGGASDSLTFDAPFDMPFYMILNLAVDSGQFGGSANKASFKEDINMYVDYVRVFQKEEGYADSAVRTASGEVKDDWTDFEGQNQIIELTDSTVVTGGDDADSDALEKWYLSTNANGVGGAATVVAENNVAKLNITDAGSQDYAVQLIGHYNAKAGYVYKVSYDIYADGDIVGKTVNCDSKETAGWSTYGIKSFSLNDENTHYEYFVQQTDDFDKCRIEFNLGTAGTGNVYISNVKVEIVDPSVLGEDAQATSRKPLSNGDMIYNGSFSQGSDHVGYWTAKEGTTVSVPRYTTEAVAEDDVKVLDVASKTNYEKLETGIKYYERRAQISAEAGLAPTLYQHGIKLTADDYSVSFDLYSKEDTFAKIALLDENGNEKAKTTIAYKAADGLKNYTVKLTTTEDFGEGSLAFVFAKDSSVQLDNVKMFGANQAPTINETPVNADTTWRGDNGGGEELNLGKTDDGALFLDGIVSGSNWYSPQIGSSNFQVAAGNNYELSFKFKFVDNANVDGPKKIKYIVQENGGSWIVVQDVVEIDASTLEQDEDGYYVYSTQFACNVSMDDCHLNFGFGDSKVTNARFTFKDVTMSLVKGSTDSEDSADMSEEVDESVFEEVKVPEVVPEGGNNNPATGNNNSSNEGNNSSNEDNNSSNDNTSAPETTAPVATTPAQTAPVVRRPVTTTPANAEAVEIEEEETPLADTVEAVEEVKEEVKEDTQNEVSELQPEEVTVETETVIEDEDTALAATPNNSVGKVVGGVSIVAVLVAILAAVYVFSKKRKVDEQ